MTLNDEIGALVLKNTRINPVNQTAYKNAFLLLSSTRALNELVTNTKPSDRARKQGIKDDAQYLKTPSGAKSDRKDPDAPDPNAPKPKARKKAPPKTDATPAQKPKAAPKKTATPKATIPTNPRGRPNDPKGVKDQKAAARKAAKDAVRDATRGVNKALDKDMGLSKKDIKGLFVRDVVRPARKQSDTDADMKSKVSMAKTAKMVKAKEKQVAALEKEAASLAKTAGSARRLGTKTQKKKK